MKIAILVQSTDFYENQRLIKTAQDMGHECELVKIQDIVIDVGGGDPNESGAFYNGESLDKFDVMIIRNVFTHVKQAVALVSFLRSRGVKIFDNNIEKVRYSMNKLMDSINLTVNPGVPFPKTIYTINETDFKDNCNTLGYPVIIKHTGSGTGIGVYKLESKEQVDEFINNLKENGKKIKTYIIQEFIPYVQDLRILVIGGQVIGAMQRIPKEGEFRANFSRGGTVQMVDISDEIKTIAEKAAVATQALNAGVDVLVTEDNKKYVLEVNRTPGFEGFEKATQKDIATLIIEEGIKNAY